MNHKTKALSLERATARRLGGTPRPNSGSGSRKGDFTACGGKFLGEHKHTHKGSYSIKLSDVLKHEKHAMLESRDWMFVIEFLGAHPTDVRRFVLMDESTFQELTNESSPE